VSWLADQRPACVAGYLSADNEPDTTAVLTWLIAEQVEVLVPASSGGAWSEPAWARCLSLDHLQAGPNGIPEPIGPRLAGHSIERANVVLCPGLAGTAAGDRLGRGRGWYDRALPLTDPRSVLVLLLDDDELLPTLPVEVHDRRVDFIITPSRVLDCRLGRPAPQSSRGPRPATDG
jgi:5-formyltetrahydrofolate cyclo-ligase